MIHRMDPPVDAGRRPPPAALRPMQAREAPEPVPDDDREWATELHWRGQRALVTCQPGDVRVHADDGREIGAALPDVRRMGRATGSLEAVFDGVIAEIDADGRATGATEGLERRLVAASDSTYRRLAARHPVAFLVFDLLWLEGHPVVELPWAERRALLDEVGLSGPAWQTPVAHRGDAGPIVEAAREAGLPGVVLKATASPYRPGARTDAWIDVRFGQRGGAD
jgi:bifunctional non-homologous end joining protein LigD